MYCREIVDGKIAKHATYSEGMRRFYFDPFEHYCVCDCMLVSPDLTKTIRQVPGQNLLGFFPDKSAMLMVKQNCTLSLVSYNDFEEIQEIPIPDKFGAGSTDSRGYDKEKSYYRRFYDRQEGIHCLFDAARKHVFVIMGEQALVLDYSEIKFRDEPHLIVRLPRDRRMVVGRSNELPIEVLDERVKYEIQKGPEGLTIKDGKLCWKPEASQIGTYEVRLRVYAGQAERMEVFEIAVGRSAFVLDFEPAKMFVSPDGGLILFQKKRLSERDTTTEIALLDTKTGKVIAERSFGGYLKAIWIDEHYVYTIPNGTTVFCMLSLADLSECKRGICSRPIYGFTHDMHGNLVVRSEARGGGDFVFSLPEGKLLNAGESPTTSSNNNSAGDITRRDVVLQGGYRMFNGLVYDGEGKLALIMYPQGYSMPGRMAKPEVNAGVKWNRKLDGRVLKSADGAMLAVIPDCKDMKLAGQVILDDYPAVFDVQVYRTKTRTKIVCEIRDLFKGEVIKDFLLMDETYSETPPGTKIAAISVSAVGKTAYVVCGGMLFAIHLAPELFKGVEAPMYIQPRIEKHVFDAAVSSSIQYRVAGGKGAKKYALACDNTGLSMNSETGELQIAAAPLVEKTLAAYFARGKTRYSSGRDDIPDYSGTDEDVLKDLLVKHAQNIAAFEDILGEKPKGIPVAVYIKIKASDENGQTCELEHYVFVDVTRERLLATIAKERKEYEVWKKEDDIRRQEYDAANLKREMGQLNADLERANKRIAELEAKIDLLLKLLGEESGDEQPGDAKEPDVIKPDAVKPEDGDADEGE